MTDSDTDTMSDDAVVSVADGLLSENRPHEAVGALQEAISRNPNPSANLIRSLAKAFYASGDLYAADDAIRAVISQSSSPNNVDLLTTARLSLEILEFDRAEVAIEMLLKSVPTSPHIASTAARLFVWQGEKDRALKILSQAIAANPDDAQLLALAVTHDDELTPETLARAEHLTASLPDSDERKTSLLFPLARLHDRFGDYERAWDYVCRANRLTQRRRSGTDGADAEALSHRLRQRIENSLTVTSAISNDSDAASGHIYLVGAPRTGSSLLQSILTAHDGVASVGERGALLSHLLNIADQCASEGFKGVYEQLRSADIAGLERQGVSSAIIVDKAPHNFYVLPLIKAVHPGSRFVNVLRDPRDVAISMLFHDFPEAFAEATDIAAIERMLRTRLFGANEYAEAGIDMLTIHYEAFVDAPNEKGAEIARYVGIEWDEGTLDPARRNAAVPTFSAGQVRRPISRPSGDRWARFAPFMGETLDRLTSLAEDAANLGAES